MSANPIIRSDAADVSATANSAAVRVDADYLSRRLAEFPLTPHLGVAVEREDDQEVILRAPLGPNLNEKGTAFAGSLYSVAVLAGWGWVTRYLAARGRACDVMIHESAVRFAEPCAGVLRASAAAPPQADIDKLLRMLDRAGRGRVRLAVRVGGSEGLGQVDGERGACVHLDGVYAVVNTKDEERS